MTLTAKTIEDQPEMARLVPKRCSSLWQGFMGEQLAVSVDLEGGASVPKKMPKQAVATIRELLKLAELLPACVSRALSQITLPLTPS